MGSESSETCLIPVAARGLRVLLVDHDTTSLLYIASVLEELFYNVRSTELASVALCMIQEKENQFDLVMADTEMKEMDIFTFLNRILTKRDMPIIFMSLDENMEMARKALNEGACFFLQKPIRRRDIANVWQHVFRKRTSSQKIENCKAFIEEKEVPNKDSCREKIIKVDGLCKIVAINDFQGREKSRLTTNKGIEDDEQKEDDPMKTDEMSILQDIFKEQIVNIEKGKQRESNIIQGINTMKKDSRGGKIEEVGRLPRVSIGSGLLGISNENLPTNRRGKRIEIDHEPGLEWRNRAKELSRITQIASMEMGNQGLSSRKRGNNDNDGRSRERRDLERSNYSKGLRSFENGSERKYTDNSSREKRLRMKWTPALHIKFMEAISALGDRKAHPKSVLRIMNEPNLTVRHVASHLQKYRDRVNRINSMTDLSAFQHYMMGAPYNPYSAFGFFMLPPDQLHNSTMNPQGFGALIPETGASMTHSSPPISQPNPGGSLNGDTVTPVHYTLETLRKALSSGNNLTKTSQSSSTNKSVNGVGSSRSSAIQDEFSNATQKDDKKQQKLQLGFDRGAQSFNYLSPDSAYSMEWTDISPSLDTFQDLENPSQFLTGLPQPTLETNFLQGQTSSDSNTFSNPNNFSTKFRAPNAANSNIATGLAALESDPGCRENPATSFYHLLKLAEAEEELREMNSLPDPDEDDIERYLDWLGAPSDSENDLPK